jgi:TonB family protein
MRIFTLVASICLLFGCVVDLRSNTLKLSQNSIAQFDPPREWQRYTVKDEEFSVSLPVHPAMATSNICLSAECERRRIERQIGAYLDGVVYTVHCSENPTGKSLDDFIGPRFQGITPTDVSVGGFQGKAYQFTSSPGDFKGVAHFFRTKYHLYEFGAVGAGIDDPRLKQFFNSIILGEQKLGTLLDDGIGSVPPGESSESESLYTGKQVDRKALVIMKPEPSYTEAARKNLVTGTVVLKVVFSSSGAITNLRIISELPMGLTERAITAAKQIKFLPAAKDGKFVSMWMQLEYNFNLY